MPKPRCKGLNRFASPCKYVASEDGWCWRHRDDPYQEERRGRAAKFAAGDHRGIARIVRKDHFITKLEAQLYQDGMTMADYVATLPIDMLVSGHMHPNKGGTAGWVPAEFHQACIKELLKRGDKLFREAYLEAISVMQQIATDTEAKDADRLKAATFIVERVGGKTPERIEVSETQPWEKLIADIVGENDELNAMKRAAGMLADE
jgi:hypothetical protein